MGAHRRYGSVAEMERAIEEYFSDCAGEIARDADGEPLYTDKGFPIYRRSPRPPTMTGLAVHLGFRSRQALINYEGYSQKFHDALTRAKLRIEQYAEERLFDRDGQRGAEFTLKCNFKWREEPDTAASDEKLNALLNGIREYANTSYQP